MAMDLIARAAAFAAQNSASQAMPRTATLDLFTNLPSRTIDPATNLLVTQGYTTAGRGSAVYVCDSAATAALAAAHPRLCKADAAGRYFRLTGDRISVDQVGALGVAGSNDQPAIQAAVAYAAAVGIPNVTLLPFHESWQPTFPGGTPDNRLGCHIIMTGDVALLGAPGRTTISLKGQGGAARTKTDGVSTWYSGWMWLIGTGITKSVLRDITVEGNITFANVKSNAESNVYDKGITMFDTGGAIPNAPNLVLVDHRNVTLRNFAGEIWYMGGTFASTEVYVENLTLTGSPQAAWNAGSLAKVTAVNLVAGDAYQPCEMISGKGHLYIGGRFFNGYSNSFITTDKFDGSYYYSYPFLSETFARWTEFRGTVFERCGQLLFTSRTKGRIVTIDQGIQLNNTGNLCDIDLECEMWADSSGGNGGPMLIFNGLANTTTQVSSCPVGTYYDVPRDIRIKLIARQTARGQSVAKWSCGVRFGGKLFDKASCVIEVVNAGNAIGTGPTDGTAYMSAAATLPLVAWDETFASNVGARSVSPSADFTVDTDMTRITLNPQVVGTFTMTLTNTNALDFTEGQVMRVHYNNGAAGRYIRLPATGFGYVCRETRILAQHGDYVDFAWDDWTNTWIEIGHKSSWVPVLTGSKTYDAPSIASGAQTTTTVTVTGAALGDYVDRISLGIDQAVLALTGYVSAANTVTVVLSNQTGAAVDLASTTLTAEVRRKV